MPSTEGEIVQPKHKAIVSGILARGAITIAAAGLFLFLRPDMSNALQRKYLSPQIAHASQGVIDEYLRTHSVRMLQIGTADNNKPGWLNTDIEPSIGQAYLDASKPFPLPDRSFKYVFSEQVIEHITYEQGLVMLKESYRILVPGGRVRLATPNLDRFIQLFQQSKTPEMEGYITQKLLWHKWLQTPDPVCYILNQQLREFGHQFVYTPKLMRTSLEAAGFHNIKQMEADVSDDPGMRNLEERGTSNVRSLNAYESMNFEAVRE